MASDQIYGTSDGESLPIDDRQKRALTRLLLSVPQRSDEKAFEQALLAIDQLPQTYPDAKVAVTFADETELYTAQVVFALSMELIDGEARFTSSETYVARGVESETTSRIVFECSADGWLEGDLDEWLAAFDGRSFVGRVKINGSERLTTEQSSNASLGWEKIQGAGAPESKNGSMEQDAHAAQPLRGARLTPRWRQVRFSALLLVGWTAFCGLRYWLASRRAGDCEWYLEHSPARSEVAGYAMRCYAEATGARDAALILGLAVPLSLGAVLWVVMTVLRARFAANI